MSGGCDRRKSWGVKAALAVIQYCLFWYLEINRSIRRKGELTREKYRLLGESSCFLFGGIKLRYLYSTTKQVRIPYIM